jgi:hypothetical protein
MAIQYGVKWFGKTGKGVPQTEQVDENGTPLYKDGKPVIGNEQFSCNQLTSDSLDATSFDSLASEMLEVAGNDLFVLRSMFLTGANRHFREQAGGTDEATKAARYILKTLPAMGGGLSTAELAQAIREGRFKLS